MSKEIFIRHKPIVAYGEIKPNQILKLHQESSFELMDDNVIKIGYRVIVNHLRGYCIEYMQYCDIGYEDGTKLNVDEVSQVLSLLAKSCVTECLRLLKDNLNATLTFEPEQLSLELAQKTVRHNLPELE